MSIKIELSSPYLYLFEPNSVSGDPNVEYKLDTSFIDEYRGKQPNWNFVGYITYKRTYARYLKTEKRTEEYFETIQRVVEGCMNILREFCLKNNIGWNCDIAQNIGQSMYKKMWSFKFTPSGRGLWVMGTEFVKKHGSMALNSCAFVSTEDIDKDPIKPFHFMMDNSMLGVGVGFDTSGANKIVVKQPNGSMLFIIPDSREGWCEALRHLLSAFLYGTALPTFDFSKLRPAGTRLESFGGVSAGSDPLKEMLKKIEALLTKRIDKKLRSVDIVDIMTLTAKCVVSGNIRRSALLGLGDADDNDYITCKQDKTELEDHRWASNNSVVGKKGMDYTKIIEGMVKNGEPAIIWIDNAKKYSRMGREPDFKDTLIKGTNPCVSGDTEILTWTGYERIDKLVGKPTMIWNGLEWSSVIPKITGHNQPMVKITLSNGIEIKCTNYHTWILKGNQRVEAKNLKIGDALEKFSMPVINSFKDLNYAYERGIYAGDGQGRADNSDLGVLLYGEKKKLIQFMNPKLISVGNYNEEYDRTWVGFIIEKETFNKDFIPFDYSKKSKLDWLSGLIDTDGTISYGKGNISIQISSIKKDFLLNIQKMLTTLGCQSTVSVMREAGKRSMPNHKEGSSLYDCKTSYRLSISTRYVDMLLSLGLKTNRVNLKSSTIRTRYAERFITVENIERIENEENVYCFTEEKNHSGTFNGIVTGQCAEQSLESMELCNLVETFPSHHISYEEYKDTLFYAFLYGKAVTLLETHWEETNEIIKRNRRMGISQSGIIEAFARHGRDTMLKWSDDGYNFLRELDKMLSNTLRINESIKITSVKPSGTVSLLANVPSGIHYQHSEYYIRRIRIAYNSELLPYLADAGYYMEADKTTPNTMVVEFPIKEKYFLKSKDDTTIEEQIQNAIDYQRYWSDNQVSITVDMKKGEESKLPSVLRYCEDKLKGISIFPEMNGYEQTPYEKISVQKYEEMVKKIKPIAFLNIKEEGIGESFCSGGFFCKST